MASRLLHHLAPPPASTSPPSPAPSPASAAASGPLPPPPSPLPPTAAIAPPPPLLLAAHTPSWVHLARPILTRACPSLHPAQTLLLATEASLAAVADGVVAVPGVLQPHRIPPGALRRMAVALRSLGPLVVAPPVASPSTVSARVPVTVRGILTAPTSPHLPSLLSSLAWRVPDLTPHAPILGAALPSPDVFLHPTSAPAVRTFYPALTLPSTTARLTAHTRFVQHAHHMRSVASATPHVADLRAAMARVWRIRCDNRLKEPFWRLAVDAIPGSRFRPWVCPGGCSAGHVAPAGRQHTFWDCPVAVAVRAQLELGLAEFLHPLPVALPPPVLVPQHAVWLLTPPCPGLDKSVWALVAVAAVAAMEFGRQLLWVLRPADVAGVAVVSNRAVARFWRLLADCAADIRFAPAAWRVRSDHPFIYAVAGSRLHVRLPVVPGAVRVAVARVSVAEAGAGPGVAGPGAGAAGAGAGAAGAGAGTDGAGASVMARVADGAT
jgi:hypothetical protein